MKSSIAQIIDQIRPIDPILAEQAKARQARLAKPPHSLGRLEDLSVQIIGLCGRDADVSRGRILVFASDNGVVYENVASAPKSVTRIQAVNIVRGMSGAGVLARCYGTECEVIDVGIDCDDALPCVRNEKVRRGTDNIAETRAMTREEAERAMAIGIDAVTRAREDGINIIGVGEMGIGNTTTSSAVLSALLSLPAGDTVGRGGGIDDESYRKKIAVVDKAIALNKPDADDPIDILSKVGGLDLCAMTGAFMASAAYRIPAVIDGYISAVAALCAYRLAPDALCAMIPSHASREGGYALAMKELGLKPMLSLDMRLGEGSGCPIAFSIARASLALFNEMATFDALQIDDSYLDRIRNDARFRGDL